MATAKTWDKHWKRCRLSGRTERTALWMSEWFGLAVDTLLSHTSAIKPRQIKLSRRSQMVVLYLRVAWLDRKWPQYRQLDFGGEIKMGLAFFRVKIKYFTAQKPENIDQHWRELSALVTLGLEQAPDYGSVRLRFSSIQNPRHRWPIPYKHHNVLHEFSTGVGSFGMTYLRTSVEAATSVYAINVPMDIISMSCSKLNTRDIVAARTPVSMHA